MLVSTLAACGVRSAAKTAATPTPTATPEAPITPPAKGWNQLASPSVAPEGRLSAISARTASDAWDVGYFNQLTYGEARQALILRYGG